MVSALATAPPPSAFESMAWKSVASSTPMTPYASPIPGISEVWSELLALARLVRDGSLPREELQDVLDSLATWTSTSTRHTGARASAQSDEESINEENKTATSPSTPSSLTIAMMTHGLPKTVDELLKREEEESAVKEKKRAQLAEEKHQESHGEPSSSLPRVTYPHLLELRLNSSFAACYDSAYRAWEQSSPYSTQLCREIFILQEQLTQQKHRQRQVKERMEEARIQLEHALLGELEEEDFPNATNEEEDDRYQLEEVEDLSDHNADLHSRPST